MHGVIETLVVAFTLGLTGAMVPGPTLVATVNMSLRKGWTMGPKVVAGHALVEVAIFLLIVRGLATAAEEHAGMISVVGGSALIIFGVLILKESRTATMTAPDDDSTSANPYLAGALTSAANPYFWIWWLSVGSALVLAGLRCSLFLAVLFMVGHWGADFGWYTLVSTSLDRGRTVLSETGYRRALTLCSVFLILFGAYYLTGVA